MAVHCTRRRDGAAGDGRAGDSTRQIDRASHSLSLSATALAGIPAEAPPQFRVVGVGVGVTEQTIKADDWALLFFTTPQFAQVTAKIDANIPSGETQVDLVTTSDRAVAAAYQVQFYLAPHWTVANLVRHSRSALGFDALLSDSSSIPVRGTLNLWEYSGSVRYNVMTRKFQPYLKLGYGLSWNRLEDITVDGEPIANPDGPWARKPSLRRPGTLLPNEWAYGLGLEIVPLLNKTPLSGPNLNLTLDYTIYNHSLGISADDRLALGLATIPTVHRQALTLSAVVSF